MKRTAAFFDFDRTLIGTDSQKAEALALLWRPPTPGCLLRLLRAAATGLLYKKNLVRYDHYNRVYINAYKGIPLSFLENLGYRIYHEQLKPLLFPEMEQAIQEHRSCGRLIILVSATSAHLLRPFVRDLKPDAWAATAIETRGPGICTGRPLGRICLGLEKARMVSCLASNLDIDLSLSYAYSDHHADLEFLETVGNAVVVNPTPLLAKIAFQRGWDMELTRAYHPFSR